MLEHSKLNSIKSISLELTDGWNYSIQLNRWFLKPIGAWPLTLCETTMEKIACMILTVVSCFLICFLLIPCTLCTILVDTDLDTKIRMIGPVSFILMAAVKQYILITRSENISECFRHIRTDWSRVALAREKDREIMVDNAKFGRWLSSISAMFMYSAGIFFTTVMPICARRTEIIDNETVRMLSFPIYRGLFDPRATPAFEIAQFTQALAGYVIYTITIGVCSVAAVFVMHACGQFQILMLKMDDLADGRERKSASSTHEGRLGDIVKHHIRILSFITRTEELLNEICLVDVVGCTLNICFLGFNMMTEWEHRETLGTMTFSSLLISFTFNIFILCYIGEILAEQCIQIGTKSYMIDWYRIPNKGALGLTLIMAMSNATIKLTAGKFMDLSLASFCSFGKIGSAAYEVNWYDLSGHQAVDLVMIITMSHYPPKLTAVRRCLQSSRYLRDTCL
ncbi:odorant receptor 4-like isoform X4 [Temnothorax longispinosus]|uniref:odorant receptor 4-like isoform X4 n=1 Tax=Temnothorax longispinosus TaxID=300112 RepID=UPI003A99EB84